MSQRRYKTGVDRHQVQLLPACVEEYVDAANPVRAIEAYVESLDLAGLGFKHASGELGAGQPAYAPGALMKLYLYGYLMRVRSSRLLERETYRNLEVIWLLGGLKPSYKTIADFRKDHAESLKAVNRDFVRLCQELDLYGAELVGIDGSFFRGNAGKGRIYTEERIERGLRKIEQDIERYLQALNEADAAAPAAVGEARALKEKLDELKQRQHHYQSLQAELKASGETQVSEVDPDARLLRKNGQCVAGYNVQIAVDAKHKLLVSCEVTNDGNDTQQLAPMANQAQEVLGVEALKVTADAGYYNQGHLKQCEDHGITPYVPEPEHRGRVDPAKRLTRDDFTFEAEHNGYRCPQGQWLMPNRVIERDGKRLQGYASEARSCADCPLRLRCLPAKTPFREIYRWEYEAVVEAHRSRMAAEGRPYLRQRAALVEHPFGTLKRWCGWTHFLVRGKAKVSGEMNLLMLCYNFKRVLSLIGTDGFRAALKQRVSRHSPHQAKMAYAAGSLADRVYRWLFVPGAVLITLPPRRQLA
jgi:transposase